MQSEVNGSGMLSWREWRCLAIGDLTGVKLCLLTGLPVVSLIYGGKDTVLLLHVSN